MRQNRYMKFFITMTLLLLSLSATFASDDSAVLEASDFQALSKQMKQNSMGLVMMLHAEHCSYCEMMDEKILSPMERSGDYAKRVFIRKLQIDKPENVIDFDGQEVTAFEVADAYDSRMTPTLVFLDYTGEEKAVKIIGINSIDLFSASVDEQIDELMDIIKDKTDDNLINKI